MEIVTTGSKCEPFVRVKDCTRLEMGQVFNHGAMRLAFLYFNHFLDINTFMPITLRDDDMVQDRYEHIHGMLIVADGGVPTLNDCRGLVE